MRIAILCLTLSISACAFAQNAPLPKKNLAPDQIAYQQAMKTYDAERNRLREAANSAYAAEMAREKAGDCPNADTTVAINLCLSHQNDVTDANYKAFTNALRAMLAVPRPIFPGEPEVSIGPTGPEATSATNAVAFDKAEAAWRSYATAECVAIDTLWRGGTIVNSMVGECNQRMARARMHELDTAYDMSLNP